LKPWLNQQWVIPPDENADFVCAMEDVLEVYHRPYDPKYPLVCFVSFRLRCKTGFDSRRATPRMTSPLLEVLGSVDWATAPEANAAE
jgi:hypothetical protein